MELDIACVFAPGRSDLLIHGMALKAESIRRSWAADRQLQCMVPSKAAQPPLEAAVAVRMRRVLAAVLAHSLDVGGRRR